jgi:small subunit ribosomal protein S20
LATHKSAEKRARQSVRKTARNKNTLGTLRTIEKKLRKLVSEKNKTEAEAVLKTLISKVDKAASKGAVHYKTASRKVGRITAFISKMA